MTCRARSNILKTFNENVGTLSPTPIAWPSASETTSRRASSADRAAAAIGGAPV